MAIPSGLASQWGFKEETTWGTAVTVDRFVPFKSESLTQEIERLESEAIIAGQRVIRTQQWTAGGITVAGDIETEVFDRSTALLMKHALGANVTAGAGPYTHTATPGSLTGLGLTVQIGKPDTGGTVRPFTYAGCKIASWELSGSAGELAQATFSFVGKSEATATALATASYASGIAPMALTNSSAAVSIAGSGVNCKAWSLSGDNGLNVDRRFIGSQMISEPLEETKRTYEGTVELEFESLTQYARFTGGTETALVITLVSGTASVVATLNVRYDGETPQVGGEELLAQNMPFKAIGTTTDASAISIVTTNGDSAA